MTRTDPYRKASVVSRDGTVIGYRETGRGPGLVLLHGGLKSSQDLLRLGRLLADSFTVCIPDRRGRGLSGPFGDELGVSREVEDMQAVIAGTRARHMFGLSAGALVTLRTALEMPAIERVAPYEAPFSIARSVPTEWVPSYERQLAEGRTSAAVISVMKGLGTEPLFQRLPGRLLVPAMAVVMRLQGNGSASDVRIRDLVPTMRNDMRIVDEMSDTLSDYANLDIPVLLMRGTKGPSYLRTAVEALAGTLPKSQVAVLPGLGHDGPEDDGGPDRVAGELLAFFGGS
ncbi:alpha/beta fold hydrolase [Peterkaempfera griseoplana]|uniref:alpha/beta fold hydrolase n=1 Tax=Peterkaempfera griseoplana TaxID=66896 RepID=UPI0006E299B9|nr:alpha/beta hydrolase [Peterkaempfera griseoplana]